MPDGTYVLNDPAYAPGGQRFHNRHRFILAITFTNAATAEMKTRIVRETDRLASLPDVPSEGETPYAAMLTADFGCTRKSLRQAASIALRELLNDYSGFNVSTIDSFFQTVLRTFSREIDHQGDYELALDRLDLIRQSISQMLDELNYGSPDRHRRLFAWIRRYMFSLMCEGSNYNIFDRGGVLLNTLARKMDTSMDEYFTTRAEELRRYLENPDAITAFCKILDTRIKNEYAAAAAAAKAFLKAAADAGVDDSGLNKSVAGRAALIAGKPSEMTTGTFKLKAVEALLSNGTPLCPGDVLKAAVCRSLTKNNPGTAEAIADAATSMFRVASAANCRSDIFRRISAGAVELEFTGMALRFLENFLRDNNTMLISDTGELLGRIISNAEMPFIYERIGMKLDSLLIDEFQDTSRMQWHNLRPLVANSIAGGHDSLIIGDVKQAIYRFRNSDPSLLGNTVAEVDFPDSHKLRGQLPEDNTNHRSAPDIVRFNNTVFAAVAARLGLHGYETVVQTPASGLRGLSSYVNVRIAPGKTDSEAVYDSLADDIRRQHAAGYNWRDILVLVRMRDQGAGLISYFMDHHPDICLLSNEALLLRNSPAIRTIMSILSIVERSYRRTDPSTKPGEDSTPHYATRADIADFNSRFNYCLSLGMTAPEAVEAALAEGPGGENLRKRIHEIRAENPANIVALIEAVVHYELSERERAEQQAYITALQDLALEHCRSSDPSVNAFVAAYERNSSRWAIQAASDLDAVGIMTIHASKGLERACVHIPFADWNVLRDNDIWLPLDAFPDIDPAIVPPMVRVRLKKEDPLTDPALSPTPAIADYCAAGRSDEILDNINMSYVAFTRASRELSVYSAQDNFGAVLREAILSNAAESETTMDLRQRVAVDDNGVLTLTIGAPTHPLRKAGAADVEPAPPYTVVYRNDARELISIDDVLSDDIVTGNECQPEITDAPDGSAAMRLAARRGNNLHAILASMDSAADLTPAVERLRLRGNITADEASEYIDVLAGAFSAGGETVASWFAEDSEVFAERSIYVPETDETFRPDRVARLADGSIAVIDYKFTSVPRSGHRRQVKEYAALISGIEKRPARAYLWYPLLNRIIEVKSNN